MSKERKVLVAVGLVCLVGMPVAAVFGCAAIASDKPLNALTPFVFSAMFWWLGSSIAQVLKDSQKK